MRATDPVVTFLLVLATGIDVGVVLDRLVGRSWLTPRWNSTNIVR